MRGSPCASSRAAWRRGSTAARRRAARAARMTSARASATRCCCPPDSCVGQPVLRGRPGRPGRASRPRALARPRPSGGLPQRAARRRRSPRPSGAGRARSSGTPSPISRRFGGGVGRRAPSTGCARRRASRTRRPCAASSSCRSPTVPSSVTNSPAPTSRIHRPRRQRAPRAAEGLRETLELDAPVSSPQSSRSPGRLGWLVSRPGSGSRRSR